MVNSLNPPQIVTRMLESYPFQIELPGRELRPEEVPDEEFGPFCRVPYGDLNVTVWGFQKLVRAYRFAYRFGGRWI